MLLVGFTGTGKQQQKTGSNYRTFPQQMKQVFLLFITRKSTLLIEEEGQFSKRLVCSKYGEKLSNTNDFVREQKIENYRFSHSYKFSLIVQNSIHTVCTLM